MPSRIDPLSWSVYIDENAPEMLLSELLLNPSKNKVMRKVIHEWVHFWHAITTTFGISLAFDSIKSMNAFRYAAKKGVDLKNINASWTLDDYKPFTIYRQMVKFEKFMNRELSVLNIFEGLARYWDTIAFFGSTQIEKAKKELINDEPFYSKAYKYAFNEIGEYACILFPIFGYLALCTNEPVKCFQYTLHNYRMNGFEIDENHNQLEDFYKKAWKSSIDWGHIIPEPYAPLDSYKEIHRRYIKWKTSYWNSIDVRIDNPFVGHPLLEDYIHTIMGHAREIYPLKNDTDLELIIFEAFAIPGIKDHLVSLHKLFIPPVTQFKNAIYYSPIKRFENNPKNFKDSMEKFSFLMGAAYGFVERAKGRILSTLCHHKNCFLHSEGLCSYIINAPKKFKNCKFKNLLKNEFNVN
jgi:hypothetical protein